MLLGAFAISVAFPVSRLVDTGKRMTFPEPGKTTVELIENVSPGMPFREAIVSWNVSEARDASLKVEVRAKDGVKSTKWYLLADWSLDSSKGRMTAKGQADEDGAVYTDTLSLKKDFPAVDIRLSLSNHGKSIPKLKLLTVCFTQPTGGVSSSDARHTAWGKTIEVPQRAQGNYPRGGVLCSATSTSMLLSHYSATLGRPELDRDVPEVEANVWDSVYKGAGNWPFNTAYFGSFPGLEGYVSRFNSLRDLEIWIEAGFPVVCSVSFDLVRGKAKSKEDSGHLIVLVGFTDQGDPVFNDPARKTQVRYTYPRADFERGWTDSGRTVYLMCQEGAKTPAPTNRAWK